MIRINYPLFLFFHSVWVNQVCWGGGPRCGKPQWLKSGWWLYYFQMFGNTCECHWSFGWDHKNRGPVSKYVWHAKEPQTIVSFAHGSSIPLSKEGWPMYESSACSVAVSVEQKHTFEVLHSKWRFLHTWYNFLRGTKTRGLWDTSLPWEILPSNIYKLQ